MGRVTLAEVARTAGVSIATASRALAPTEHPDVSRGTRERLRAVADELGYRPSLAARAFRRKDFRAVSIIVPDGQWGWWESAVRAAHGAAREQGCQAFVQPTTAGHRDSGDIADVIAGLAEVPTEGVLLFGSAADSRMLAAADALRRPVVAIDSAAEDVVVPTLAVDSAHGIALAVQHLVDTGCRRLAYVGSEGDLLFQRRGRESFRAALSAAGLPVAAMVQVAGDDPALEVHPAVDELLGVRAGGGAGADGPGIDAVVCESEHLAPQVLRSLRRAGLRVPDDVSVVGFDDSPLALALDPPLTSVRQPYEQLGRDAIELLLARIAGQHVPVGRTLLQPVLMPRSSSRRLS